MIISLNKPKLIPHLLKCFREGKCIKCGNSNHLQYWYLNFETGLSDLFQYLEKENFPKYSEKSRSIRSCEGTHSETKDYIAIPICSGGGCHNRIPVNTNINEACNAFRR